MQIFDVQQIFDAIKTVLRTRSLAMIKKDPLLGEDTSQDHNQIEMLLYVKYLIRTLKLILIILNFSYFLGMFWLIISRWNEHFVYEYYYELSEYMTADPFPKFKNAYCSPIHDVSRMDPKEAAKYDLASPHCRFYRQALDSLTK